MGFSLIAADGDYSLVAVHGFLLSVASLAVEQGSPGCTGFSRCGVWLSSCDSQALQHRVVMAHGLGFSAACGIYPD